MKTYKAIQYFTDLQDNNYSYSVGSTYPREGLVVSDERIKELLSRNNKQNRPVIEEVDITSKKKHYTAKQLESMRIAQIEDIAEKYGYKITRTLKADIIDEFMSQQ